MTEPTSSAVALGVQAVGATAMLSVMTGLDYWTLLGGVSGALMALRSQDSQGPGWAFLGLISVTLLSLFATWFCVETLPAIAKAFGIDAWPALGQGRVVIAWVVGYYAQTVILPAGGRALSRVLGRIGGQSAQEEKQ